VTSSIDVAAPQLTSAAAIQPDMPATSPNTSAGEQVAVHVAAALQDGSRTITVELHPAELGRVEIRLSFESGSLNVQMTVDRQSTFEAFSRDRGGLEQQLGQAGVDLGSGGLDLRLGQQSDQSESNTSGGGAPAPRAAAPTPAPSTTPTTTWVGNGLIDILA
jgi:flagellar hook-length control protein FliK